MLRYISHSQQNSNTIVHRPYTMVLYSTLWWRHYLRELVFGHANWHGPRRKFRRKCPFTDWKTMNWASHRATIIISYIAEKEDNCTSTLIFFVPEKIMQEKGRLPVYNCNSFEAVAILNTFVTFKWYIERVALFIIISSFIYTNVFKVVNETWTYNFYYVRQLLANGVHRNRGSTKKAYVDLIILNVS